MLAIKQFFIDFFASPLVMKILMFLSAFFAPLMKLYLLLLFLTIVDYCIDITVWYINQRKVSKHTTVTLPFVLKIIMYSLLVIVVHAVQVYLIEDIFDFFKLVVAIPIIAETLGIVASVERYTGVQILDKVKGYLGRWINSKEDK
ncbi:phage holin family protein [Sphingobacterium chungjuense]|uniref:phage holin family protein n=1 Tax=Sphingobacterium chungjuense TaxID=2675553 RepID=UPI00140CF9B8|nr:phage holin family protein [Sphingobacterium chungjuense]